MVSGGAGADPVFGNVGNTDQRSKIETFNIAPTYTAPLATTRFSISEAYVRRDQYNYYPSNNPLADLGPIQTQSIAQDRSLTNAGVRSDYFVCRRGSTISRSGRSISRHFCERTTLWGLSTPPLIRLAWMTTATPLPGFTNPSQCAAAGFMSNDPTDGGSFNPVLLPYDLTRGGSTYNFVGHTDVKELALYVQDQIKARNWLFNVGIRGDLYNGLAIARQAEPRLGVAYSVDETNTVLRLSYARTLESPFNENLVLSSQGCTSDVLSPLLNCTPGVSGTLRPGFQNEFHAGLQQAFGKNFVISGDYIWKYTHNAFDFSVLGNTPITFPIDWHNSKIPGFALRADVPNFHNLSAFVVMSSVAARFFPPQVAGAGATVGQSGFPFRIDHDERFNQTTHLQYQIPGSVARGWDSIGGMIAADRRCGALLQHHGPEQPCNPITADRHHDQRSAGNRSERIYPRSAVPGWFRLQRHKGALPTWHAGNQCLASQLTSKLVRIPAPGTENDDHNPPRIAPRSLFDASIGEDNLFNGDKHKWSLRLTAVNITNKYALYNFLSTFSGTHYVTPRAMTAEVGFHF